MQSASFVQIWKLDILPYFKNEHASNWPTIYHLFCPFIEKKEFRKAARKPTKKKKERNKEKEKKKRKADMTTK